MGAALSHPKTDKSYNEGDGLGLRYGLCSMQGWRSQMEDAHDIKIGLKYGLENWCYFAVFDGHAGKRAAAFAAWNLLEFILRDSQLKLQTQDLPSHVPIEPNLRKGTRMNNEDTPTVQPDNQEAQSSPINQQLSSDQEPLTESLGDSSKQIFSTENPTTQSDTTQSTSQKDTNEMKKNPVPKPELISLPVAEQLTAVKEAIRSGFLRIDESMRESGDLSGCTAVCALISPTHLFIANCGDSRAVLFDGEKPTFATEDHKPLNPKERQRIINAGGIASQRVNGTLAVSRALGDFEFKKDLGRGPCEQLVSPEPEVTAIQRHPDDEFLIIACDGIWDVMNNEELCKFIRYQLQIDKSVQSVCSSVLDLCLQRGSKDNMSIIIVVFQNGPKFDENMRAKEETSDIALAELARSLVGQCSEWNDFNDRLLHRIDIDRGNPMIENIQLPPVGGLDSKSEMLRKIFDDKWAIKYEGDSSDHEDNDK